MDIKFWIPIILSIILVVWNTFQQMIIQNLKKSADKKLHIHRIQFEKEFEIYSKLWSDLVKLRDIAIRLRPSGDIMEDPNLSYDENINNRLKKAVEVGNSVIWLVQKNKPFYSPEIYSVLDKIIRLVRREITEVQLTEKRTRQYWNEGDKAREDLLSFTDDVCEKIRIRIGILDN